MPRDNWERLAAAVLNRENLREFAHLDSFNSSTSAASSISSDLSPIELQPMEFEEIKKATKNFGKVFCYDHGIWAPVFKGWIDERTLTASIPGMGIAIAVKIWNLKLGLQAFEEWLMELSYLSKLRHPNVVKLIAYCSNEENMFSVYEFMSKGSLDNHLFRRMHKSLSWARRIKVAVDVARALSFFHDKEKQILHQSFSTSDILLDGDFNAKVHSFSLARDVPTCDTTHGTPTIVTNTYVYAAPDYITTGVLTTKCNVYSFGVVLLELLSGHRVSDQDRPIKQQNLTVWAKPYLQDKRKVLRVMDPTLEGQYSRKEAYSVATVALQCLRAVPERRPHMAHVLDALQRVQSSMTT